MEKTRKLRLKRKIPQQKVLVSSEHSREQNVSESEAVTLSSDSEDGSGGQQCKQRKVLENTHSGVKSIGFLQTNNPSLNRLREMILSLSPKDVELNNLSPFPIHTQIEPNSKGSETVMFQERLQSPNKVQSLEDLPPFPIICRHSRRQPLESQTAKLILNPNLESSDSDKLIITPAIDNGCTKLTTKESIQTDFKQSIKSSTLKDSNHRSCKIQTPFTNVPGDDNSGSIRDRNSNLYALQTRNRHVRPEDMNRPVRPEDRNRHVRSEDRNRHVRPEDRNPESSGSDKHTGHRDRNFVKTGSMKPQFSLLNKQTDQERNIMEKGIDKCAKLGNSVANNQSSKTKKEDSKDKEKEEIKSGGILQNCPLCQMEFDSRFGQMEIDSHIATCLSSAEDDVVW